VLSALGRFNDELLGSCKNVAVWRGPLYTVLYKSDAQVSLDAL
jgi:hypothetical protein